MAATAMSAAAARRLSPMHPKARPRASAGVRPKRAAPPNAALHAAWLQLRVLTCLGPLRSQELQVAAAREPFGGCCSLCAIQEVLFLHPAILAEQAQLVTTNGALSDYVKALVKINQQHWQLSRQDCCPEHRYVPWVAEASGRLSLLLGGFGARVLLWVVLRATFPRCPGKTPQLGPDVGAEARTSGGKRQGEPKPLRVTAMKTAKTGPPLWVEVSLSGFARP